MSPIGSPDDQGQGDGMLRARLKGYAGAEGVSGGSWGVASQGQQVMDKPL